MSPRMSSPVLTFPIAFAASSPTIADVAPTVAEPQGATRKNKVMPPNPAAR